VRHRETVVHPHVGAEHLVQLFDSADSLADAVTAFLRDGWLQGDTLLVVIDKAHWGAITRRLRANDLPPDNATNSGQLTVRDAAETLQLFMRHGRPNRELFDRSIGTLVQQLVSQGRRLRIYGEMVDVLSAEGNFQGAQLLEDLWNELGARESFTLFCGYSSVNFGDPRTAETLRSICRSHSHVRSNPRDILGSFLLSAHAVPPPRASHVGR
jgi:hypothetical protein